MKKSGFGNICKAAQYIHPSPSHTLLQVIHSLFSIFNFSLSFSFPKLPENLNCLTYHSQTPRSCAVESCGSLCMHQLCFLPHNRLEGEGCSYFQFLFLFCPACSRDLGVHKARTTWSYSPSTNLSC